MSVEKHGDLLRFQCPHCNGGIEVLIKEINCKIFRHGFFIKDDKPINPHEKKETCERYAREGLIYGCGKPYELYDNWKVRVCEYK